MAIIMVRYILTDPISYPMDKEDWKEKANRYYKDRLIQGFLDKESFLRKLQMTFTMTEMELTELPSEACGWIFGYKSYQEYIKQKNINTTTDRRRAWKIQKDRRSVFFFKYQEKLDEYQKRQVLYPLPVKTAECVYVAEPAFEGNFLSDNYLFNLFMNWYRGMTKENAISLNYDKAYLSSFDAMIHELTKVFGKHKYLRILEEAVDHRQFLP